MKAIRLHARGGPEVFTYEDAPQPRPGAGEVLVRVHGAAVTPTELLWLSTWATPTGERRRFPIILGHEFSGEVATVGDGIAGAEICPLAKMPFGERRNKLRPVCEELDLHTARVAA